MERYSEYKDSGVKWLGEIPSHWELLKSKYLWKETFENSTSGKEDLLSVSQYTGVTKSKADSRSESLIGYKIVHKDDLVINIMLAWLGGLGVSNDEGVVSPAYCTYKLIRDYNPKFLHYLYKTPMYLAEFARHSTGVVPSRWRMYTDDFGQVVSLLPPVEEQDAIVLYLDAATSKIDKAIAMQQKMIDLLNERKQIIIQNAVTKGLDDKVEMKDSGVEWIGMIPKHWEILKLKRCAFIKTGTTPPTNERKYFEGGRISWFTPGDMNNMHLEFASKMITQKAIDDKVGRLFPAKTIYFVGIGATVAKVSACDFEASSNQQINAIICNKSLDYRFATYVLKSEQEFIRNMANYVTLPIINQSDTGLIDMIVSPKSEQQAIVAYLDKQMQRFDSAISNCQRQIALLQERKQIIINEVVTGKVKVS